MSGSMLSIVVPIYNSEKCINVLYTRISLALQNFPLDYELILVDDGSKDDSWLLISTLAKQDKRVKGLRFTRNFGQHYGITAGLDFCQGDWVVVMDCDLQDPPETIPILYEKAINAQHDIVFVKRLNGPESPLHKLLTRSFYRVFRLLSGMEHEEYSGNFCILSKPVLENYKTMREQARFFSGLINWTGFSVGAIEAKREDRHVGRSTYTFRKRLKLATDAIIAYSDKPLRISVKVGFGISALALLYGITLLLKSVIYHTPISNWSSLMASLYFLSGIIIGNLGIIGIYLGRTFDEVKRRPLYIIKERTCNAS
ncbi:MAG: glycosyltransferase family 2 protein [Gammaproteobacteria bacterium]|nr:glycosyltransferase family 2 protein [Gammaproteobacteria bacterium]